MEKSFLRGHLAHRENSAPMPENEIRDVNFFILLESHEEIPRLRAVYTVTTPHPLRDLDCKVDPLCTLSSPALRQAEAAQGPIAVVLGDIPRFSTTLSIFTSTAWA